MLLAISVRDICLMVAAAGFAFVGFAIGIGRTMRYLSRV